MTRLMRVLALAICCALPVLGAAQDAATSQPPERAIRRDIPITNAIRRAYEAATRDSTGKPGRNYWQLRTDYTIQARIDPSTQTITGRETIALHNESPEPLTEIRLRLDSRAQLDRRNAVMRVPIQPCHQGLTAVQARGRSKDGRAHAEPRSGATVPGALKSNVPTSIPSSRT